MREKHVGRHRDPDGPPHGPLDGDDGDHVLARIVALGVVAAVVAVAGPFVHPWWPGELRRTLRYRACSKIAHRSWPGRCS